MTNLSSDKYHYLQIVIYVIKGIIIFKTTAKLISILRTNVDYSDN